MTGLILVSIVIAINCGYAVAALRRPHAATAGRGFAESAGPDQRRARMLLAFNLIVMAAIVLFMALQPA